MAMYWWIWLKDDDKKNRHIGGHGQGGLGNISGEED